MLTLSRGRKVGPAIFDRRNQELTHGLISYYSPVLTGPTGLQLLDLSGQDNHGTLTGMDAPTDWVDSPYGRVLDFDGVNDRVKLNRHFSQLPMTLAAWFRVDSAATIMQLVCVSSTTSNNPLLCLNFRGDLADDPITAQFRGETTATNSTSERTGVVVGRWHFGVAVFRNLSNRQVYLDGVAGAADTATYDSPVFDAMNLGVWERTAFLQWLDGQIAEACIWNRALTPSEIQTLYALEPGGLGRRLRDDFFLYETAIAYSLTASTASYTLTGQPVPLLYGRSLPADTGSVLLSGQTTPLLTSRLLNADQGAYAYTGTDAATLLGRLLDAGAAAYTLDGNAAGFLASRRISADTVAYLASGLDVGFLRSRVLEAGTGQYVLVASPINITTGTGGAAPYYYLFLLGGSR